VKLQSAAGSPWLQLDKVPLPLYCWWPLSSPGAPGCTSPISCSPVRQKLGRRSRGAQHSPSFQEAGCTFKTPSVLHATEGPSSKRSPPLNTDPPGGTGAEAGGGGGGGLVCAVCRAAAGVLLGRMLGGKGSDCPCVVFQMLLLGTCALQASHNAVPAAVSAAFGPLSSLGRCSCWLANIPTSQLVAL
jgi:hypothetical protein